MKKLLFSLIIYFLSVCTLFAYTEKNLLQQKTSEERLKELLVLHQQWVAYPVNVYFLPFVSRLVALCA